MAQNLQALLEELTSYPATEQPVLSLYLDLRPDGNGRRTDMLQTLEQSLDMIRDQVKARNANLESFDADRERIMDYVNTEAPVDAQAVAIFACEAEGLWYTTPLQAPVETHIFEGRYPHVFDLARVIDDYETYAVVLADSQESRIFVVTLNNPEKVGETESSEPIKRFEAGGWGQMLFQRRTENIVKAHTKEIADKLGRLMKRYDVEHVIIAGNDSIKGTVLGSLPQQIKDKLVDYVHIDITANMQHIMETIEPLMRQAEREQEADDVDTLEGQVNTKGGLGVIGVEDTAMALSKGQVRLLIMHQNFNATGSLNPQTQFVYGGMHAQDPFDGSDLETVNLREAFPSRAAQTGATVQIVEANKYLENHEGVGALLWYRDDVEQPQQREDQADLQRGG